MNDFVVDAGADAGGETVIALETGRGAHFTNAPLGERIDITGGLAGLHHLHDLAQHGRHDAAGLPHDLDFAGGFDFDTAAFLNPGTC